MLYTEDMPDKVPKILLIESNLFIGGLLSQKLRAQNYCVVAAREPKAGLHLLVSEKPSIVFLDLPIGEIKIFLAVVRRLHKDQRTGFPPVIVLSDIEEEKDITALPRMGVHTYLVKAYTDINEMAAKIKDVMAFHDKPEAEKDLQKDHIHTHDDEFKPPITEIKKIKAAIEQAIVSQDEEMPIVSLMDNLVVFAYLMRASDIHFKPELERLAVRMRVDGVLQEVFAIPRTIHSEIITRIKVLAGMRTDEHQAAQDGRFKTNIRNLPHQFDVRVSVVPTYYGENAVLRLLVEPAEIKALDNLAFSDIDRAKIKRAIAKPNGMVLATGPTGSGKTTTLYTMLRQLCTPDVSIITIEDPIEYSLTGINQIQVNAQTGLTFADGLRSILRQDPDIIMVGEIRDKETAGIAVNAALTGHLLLSTLHTNDAATTLPRLLDMGIEPFLIASTVNVALGQRLVRTLCNACKLKRKIGPAELKSLTSVISAQLLKGHKEFYYPKGCKACVDTGYSGRIGIYEVLEMDDPIREAIMRRENSGNIRKAAIQQGMTTLMEDGFSKVASGLTSIEELLRAVTE